MYAYVGPNCWATSSLSYQVTNHSFSHHSAWRYYPQYPFNTEDSLLLMCNLYQVTVTTPNTTYTTDIPYQVTVTTIVIFCIAIPPLPLSAVLSVRAGISCNIAQPHYLTHSDHPHPPLSYYRSPSPIFVTYPDFHKVTTLILHLLPSISLTGSPGSILGSIEVCTRVWSKSTMRASFLELSSRRRSSVPSFSASCRKRRTAIHSFLSVTDV